ncbi:alginate lyase family protein [Rubellicoccus peritrichatus]|uniref:Alginate lyase family protein n=1 Tax=Rubellicoccus peritrichatus TaxID=3080537 RepID=A0AAQ3LDN8_9BACT|nr:alginate lyase family protein [Puniceicoccus sp. CR14]WOO43571.1 alginate lyase family protein [Puniceicoccus sp. CR14]
MNYSYKITVLLIVGLVCAMVSYAGSAAEFLATYPKHAQILFEQIDWDSEGLSELEEEDHVARLEGLIKHFQNSPTTETMRAAAPAKRGHKGLDVVIDALVNSELKPEGYINFSKQPPAMTKHYLGGAITRFEYMLRFSAAWHGTGDPKYFDIIKRVLNDLAVGQPPVVMETYDMQQHEACWISLETALRMENLYKVYFSAIQHPDMDDEIKLLILAMLWEHADHLLHHGSGGQGNWMTTEGERLLRVALVFPEYKDSEAWADKAVQRFTSNMDGLFYPDGSQCELSIMYGYISFRSAMAYYNLLKEYGREMPEGFKENLQQQIRFYSWVCTPDGQMSSAGDGNYTPGYFRTGLGFAEQLGVEDAIHLITKGEEGASLEGPSSTFFDYSGYAISRDSVGADNEQWSLFDMGPYGTGHVHNDALHLTVYSKRLLLVDTGRYHYTLYDGWHEGYFKATRGHNTVGIAGCDQYFPYWRAYDDEWNEYMYSRSYEPIAETEYEITDDYDFFRGRTYNGYIEPDVTGKGYGLRLKGKNAHERGVHYERGEFWAVIDRVFTDERRSVEVFWHFHPDVKNVKMLENGAVVSYDANEGNVMIYPIYGNQEVEGKLFYGSEEPKQGWYAPRYGTKVPAWAVEYYSEAEYLAWFGWLIVPFEGDKIPEVSAIATSLTNHLYRIDTVIDGETATLEMQLDDTPEFQEDKYSEGLLPYYIVTREKPD